MKKIFIYCILGILALTSNIAFTQIQFESSIKHGQILDVNYSPVTPNLIFARTVTNHIVKSTDLGQTWETLHSVPQENNYITIKDLRITDDGNFLTYLCVAEGTEFNRIEVFNLETGEIDRQLYSPLAGVSGSLVQSYSIAKSNLDVALLHTTKMVNWMMETEVYYTNDAGANWTPVYLSVHNDDIHVNNVAISPFNDQKLYIMRGASPNGVEGGFLVSEDAGLNWEEQIFGLNFSALTFHPTNPNIMYLGTFYLGENQNQTLFRTTNGGMSWVEMMINWTSMASNSIHSIIMNPNNSDNIVVLEENEIAITHDNGVTWESYVYNDEDYEQYYYGITGSFNPFVEDQVIISANYFPFISNDGGVTLEKFETPFVNGTHRMSIYNGENQHVYYGLRGGFIYKNLTEGTETEIGFSPIGFFPNISSSGVFADSNKEGRIFMSTMSMMGNAAVFVSDDNGTNFTPFYSDSYILLIGLETLKSNPNYVLMSFGEMLYKYDLSDLDNVVSTNVNLPTFGLVNSMMFGQNENEFVISIQNKIYKTTDSGQSWSEISSGLETVTTENYIYDIAQNPFNENHWAAATSVGIFTTENAGQNWTQSYNLSPINQVSFSPFVDGVIAGTSRFEDGSEYPSSLSEIVYTKDSGANWEVISTDQLGYLRTMNSDVMFNEDETFYAYFHVQDFGLIRFNVDVSTDTQSVWDVSHKAFTIYPNPASDKLNIDSEKQIKSVIIYNSIGQVVIQSNNKTIDVSHLNSGVYFVSIIDENNLLHTHKLIVR